MEHCHIGFVLLSNNYTVLFFYERLLVQLEEKLKKCATNSEACYWTFLREFSLIWKVMHPWDISTSLIFVFFFRLVELLLSHVMFIGGGCYKLFRNDQPRFCLFALLACRFIACPSPRRLREGKNKSEQIIKYKYIINVCNHDNFLIVYMKLQVIAISFLSYFSIKRISPLFKLP